MNTEDKIAEQAAEIARLNAALANRKAKIAELMGEAARADIAGASVRGAGKVPEGFALVPRALRQEMDVAIDSAKLHSASNQHLWDCALAAAPAASAETDEVPNKMARLGQYVTDFAKRGGWNPDDGEGAFEFVQRYSYVVGIEDAGGKVAFGGTKTNGSRWPISAFASPAVVAPLPEQTGPSDALPEEWRVKLKSIADWMDSSAQQQQISPEEFSYVSSFDYELAQAASELFALAASPSSAQAPTQPQDDIEARTERIRLSHANADSKGKIQLRREVEWLLAHIALLRSPQDGFVPPLVATPVSQQEITRLDILSLIHQQCHRCYASAIDREDIDTKYMQEIDDALRTFMGGITSKESVETAAPGASIGDKQ